MATMEELIAQRDEKRANQSKLKKQKRKNILEYITTVLITSLVVGSIITFIAQPVLVNGDSMNPTLKNHQLLIISKYNKTYSAGDIVVFKYNNQYLIKRVVGTPSDSVQIIGGEVYVNNKVFKKELGVCSNAGIASTPIKLQNNSYFVMGDNRNNSFDSRYPEVGPVSNKVIKGKVIFRFIPLKIF